MLKFNFIVLREGNILSIDKSYPISKLKWEKNSFRANKRVVSKTSKNLFGSIEALTSKNYKRWLNKNSLLNTSNFESNLTYAFF